MPRSYNRANHALRPASIELNSFGYGEGSTLIRMGNTIVLCSASVEAGVPPWMRGQGRGWITGEYALLPRSTGTRNRRERQGASGRTQEIQRLIGRALRASTDMGSMGDRTITVDCDVLQADGGTRTAAITGGYVALALAFHTLVQQGQLERSPITTAIAAVSAGYVNGQALLDLDYSEDSTADLDCNLVLTGANDIIEVQCTAEHRPISRSELDALLSLAFDGVAQLLELQRSTLRSAGVDIAV